MGILSFLFSKKSDNTKYNSSQHKAAISNYAYNHLVLAGAGAGKTTSIVRKVKEILRTGEYRKNQILVLSFTNSSAAELKKRILNETSADIDVMTFHKLGMNILTEAYGITPRITDIKLTDFISSELRKLIADFSYLRKLNTYFIENMVRSKSEFDFKNQDDYDDYLRKNPPVTFRKEKVKSYGEMEMANFLYISGIRYVYEKSYKYDTRTKEYAQYHPDFYLPDYDVYIEYFGIDRNGCPPAYFTGNYTESMRWKRKLHAEKGTVMIEAYAYEHFSGELLSELEKKLEKNGIIPEPENPEKIWEEICDTDPDVLTGIRKLFESVINLMKSRRYTVDDVRKLNRKNQRLRQINKILNLIEPVYDRYQEKLQEKNEIDFNDMITKAADCIRSGKYKNRYRLVIVDEYQDISSSRADLLKAMRESGDFDLFCVGDDWQSIYRFAGSDIGFIQNFSSYWGKTKTSLIETSYRSPQRLAEITSEFIKENPQQFQKDMNSASSYSGCVIGEVQGFSERKAVEFMEQKLDDLPEGCTVFMIGRYDSDKNILEKSNNLTLSYDNKKHEVTVIYRRRSDLKIRFLTAHRSKGLEADYVFIINNKQGRMGFPSGIQDDPVLDLLLDNTDDFPYAEERRLFYVAMTRARRKVILLTVKDHESVFVKELKEYCAEDIKKEAFTCPLCGGWLSKKSSENGVFMGCENFSTTGCSYTRWLKK